METKSFIPRLLVYTCQKAAYVLLFGYIYVYTRLILKKNRSGLSGKNLVELNDSSPSCSLYLKVFFFLNKQMLYKKRVQVFLKRK